MHLCTGSYGETTMPPRTTLMRIELTPEQERCRQVSVPQAAEYLAISPDTFEETYGHLIRKISKRRRTVKLGDLLDIVK
jgi:hypothetical protein